MRIKADKTIGYALLSVGLILIIFSVCSMLYVFTGATNPPSIFNMKSVTISLPAGEGMPPKETELLPGAELSKVVNMVLWSVLMLFIASGGSRIGGLGVKLIREIKVEVKRED